MTGHEEQSSLGEERENPQRTNCDIVQPIDKKDLLKLTWFSLQSIHRQVGLGSIYPIDVPTASGGDKKEALIDKLLQAHEDGICNLSSALQGHQPDVDHGVSPTDGTLSPSLTSEDLYELNLEQLKHVYIDLFARQLFMLDEKEAHPMSVTVRNSAFTEKSAMVNYLLFTFELRECDLSEDLLNTVIALRLKKKWNERMTSRSSTFSQLLHLLPPASIRNLYTAQGFGSVLKNKDSKSKNYMFYDSSSNIVEWKSVVERLESVKLVRMDSDTFQTFTEMYDSLKEVKEHLVGRSSDLCSPVTAQDLLMLPDRFFKDLCVLRGVGSWDYGIYRFFFVFEESGIYDQNMVLNRLLTTGLTKADLKQYIDNMLERLFPSPSDVHRSTPKKWDDRLGSTSTEFSDFLLQFLPQAFIIKLYAAKNLGELKNSAGGEYEFLDQHSNIVSWNEAKDKLLAVVGWVDMLSDGWYRQIYKEIRGSLRSALHSFGRCSKPGSALASKTELLQLPSCILKDLCCIRYEFLDYVDIRRCFVPNSTLDEEGLANVLLLTSITKGELLLYIHNTILRLTPAALEVE